MPIYEFLCGACEARFEDLVAAGTESVACPACGAEGAARTWSPQAGAFKLVKTPRQNRKQERANAQLRARTKQGFKEARTRAREGRGAAGSAEGGPGGA